jgi:pimeloyl-ACP methyl ester carboxylesterase
VSALVIIDSRPAIPAERLQFMHARGRRMPRAHASEEAAVAAFRLLPRETAADPAFLAHLARAGMTRRHGGWGWRFDPATHGNRQPVDAWPLLSRITAPTLIARGALSPILPPDMADRLHAGIAGSTLITIPGAYHHLTLDRPTEFATALQDFLALLNL